MIVIVITLMRLLVKTEVTWCLLLHMVVLMLKIVSPKMNKMSFKAFITNCL
jgi:hypothetical protein